MLKVVGADRADLRNPEFGAKFHLEWVVIGNPDQLPAVAGPPILPGLPPILFALNTMTIHSPLPGRPAIPPGDYRGSEFCGACFDPAGEILFVNVQTPGVSFAITGPW